MRRELLYIESKNGAAHRGSAWIGFGEYSKSGKTIYFNDRALQSSKGRGSSANYFDVETEEPFWVSGPKHDLTDRHQFGTGTIMVERAALRDYLEAVGLDALPKRGYEIVEIEMGDVKKRVEAFENQSSEEGD